MAEEGAGGVPGVGEEEPDGLGTHGGRGGGKFHEAEPFREAGEEGDV